MKHISAQQRTLFGELVQRGSIKRTDTILDRLRLRRLAILLPLTLMAAFILASMSGRRALIAPGKHNVQHGNDTVHSERGRQQYYAEARDRSATNHYHLAELQREQVDFAFPPLHSSPETGLHKLFR